MTAAGEIWIEPVGRNSGFPDGHRSDTLEGAREWVDQPYVRGSYRVVVREARERPRCDHCGREQNHPKGRILRAFAPIPVGCAACNDIGQVYVDGTHWRNCAACDGRFREVRHELVEVKP